MPLNSVLSLLGSEALVSHTPAGLALQVWQPSSMGRRLRKRSAPDDGSLVAPGDRVRLVALIHDTQPENPQHGVAFWRVRRLGRYVPHATRGGLPLLEYQGSAGDERITYRCVGCGVTITRRWDEPLLPQADCTATPEQRGQALGDFVRLALSPPRHVDGTWERTWTLEDQQFLQDVFAAASPAEWVASGLEQLRQASAHDATRHAALLAADAPPR